MENSTVTKPAFAALLCIGLSAAAAPALAQEQAAPAQEPAASTAAHAPTPAQPSTEASAGKMTQEQIAAFNQAVADFTAGQQLQHAANNAGAIVKYESALPAIRTAVKVQPNNMDYVSFLANTLYADAAAQAAVQNFDAVISLYQEALPQWRKIVAAKPADANSRNIDRKSTRLNSSH